VTETFDVPGYVGILKVEYQALDYPDLRKITKRHERVRDEAQQELLTAVDTLMAASVNSYEVKEDGSEQVLELAKVSPQGPVALANALYRLEGAGIRGERALKALKAASDLAAVGNANVEDTAKTLAQAYFSGIKGLGGFNNVVAELNATVGAGDLRLQQLVDALGTGHPAGREPGRPELPRHHRGDGRLRRRDEQRLRLDRAARDRLPLLHESDEPGQGRARRARTWAPTSSRSTSASRTGSRPRCTT
jgi:hypothetical protein